MIFEPRETRIHIQDQYYYIRYIPYLDYHHRHMPVHTVLLIHIPFLIRTPPNIHLTDAMHQPHPLPIYTPHKKRISHAYTVTRTHLKPIQSYTDEHP
jgi:hypothetical protein